MAFVTRKSRRRREYLATGAELRKLAASVADRLTESNVEMLTELIDVGEPGVGFELLVTWLDESEAILSEEEFRDVAHLAIWMGIPSGLWRGLPVSDSSPGPDAL
ncbi:hypothetical protein D1871_22590 [Nakamurella silvestris]|nr:hypothetical protein D1871_22590 [Nakamurella silvestris]